jgi:uncharacterized membrane protein YqaE (UPF0057 family)
MRSVLVEIGVACQLCIMNVAIELCTYVCKHVHAVYARVYFMQGLAKDVKNVNDQIAR